MKSLSFRWILAFTVLLALASIPSPGRAADLPGSTIGSGHGVLGQVYSEPFDRSAPTYMQNCDGTFENGFCWQAQWHQRPYDSALAEGFSGPGLVLGIRLYLTGIGHYSGEKTDLFVWDDADGVPSTVLALRTDVSLQAVPNWPQVGENDLAISARVNQKFYVGHNGVWPNDVGVCFWFLATDEDGPGGDSWTYAAPGLPPPYPHGWVPLSQIDGAVKSTGTGVYIDLDNGLTAVPGPGAEDTSWGKIKNLY